MPDPTISPRDAEALRLASSESRDADWKNWGPYVSERAWGTVREDYSADGNAWAYFPHDQARSRAYRWNEDGLAGFCNRYQNLCLGLALWNGKDPYLKERLFGLSGPEGNHGEDVKEYYFYLDGTPTHSYMKMLYKYPHAEFPYERLRSETARLTRADREYELCDAIGDDLRAGRYFDVFVEYAKLDEEDILCRIVVENRGPDPAPIHVLPHLWFRNTWSWGHDPRKPELKAEGPGEVRASHRHLGERWWYVDGPIQDLLFTDNETNNERLFDSPNAGPYVKDGIHEAVAGGNKGRVNPERAGTKAAAHGFAEVAPGGSFAVRVRFTKQRTERPFDGFDRTLALRREECDAFHQAIQGRDLSDEQRRVQRQALAGLLWSKQFYHYSVELWEDGDPASPPPPKGRARGRNASWRHFYALDVLSVPDKWEYPWFAAWDTAFHCIPLAMVDPEWSKRQIILMLREWYMHPNGQLPAYEWDFADANPPVHAMAARRVYEMTRDADGNGDVNFLEEVFQKLLLNFTWWVNRKDADGRNAFQGGFLGLDNIGVFDRSNPESLPDGARLEQADGTAWMGLYCLEMLGIAIELAKSRPAYEAMATKFFEHFAAITHAIVGINGQPGMWDERDGFFYDMIRGADGSYRPIRLRSFVGLIPIFGVLAFDADMPERLPQFWKRVEWYGKYRPTLVENARLFREPGPGGRRLLTIVDRGKLEAVLARMLDPEQFLSDHGLRSLSREHEAAPFTCDGQTVKYEPAESHNPMYGGNSNWRGPVWFPVNVLMIGALAQYHQYFGDSLKVEMPKGSGRMLDLKQLADELASRLMGIFLPDPKTGRRPVFGDNDLFHSGEHWRNHIPFYEYFHGDEGAGLGASHQTGWTALVADLIAQSCQGSTPLDEGPLADCPPATRTPPHKPAEPRATP